MILQTPEIRTIDDITYQLDSDIPYTGSLVVYYDNKEKACEGNYVNGKEHGLWTMWDDGQKISEGNMKDGMCHGPETHWHIEGVISTKGQYLNDKRTGIWRSWHTNGHISGEGMYKNGERHGLWTYWYSKKTFDYVFSSRIEEQIATKMNYADGVLNGTCVEWHSNGNKKLKTDFSHGLKNGMYTRWHANGHKKTDGKYVANIDKNRQHKTGAWSYWNEDGRLTAKEAYREGILIGELV
jgi:antitoxin component YwqK of YwqJK toxin-antitoxin module